MAPQIYNFTPWMSLLGGAIIGLAATLHLLTTGRILGASGIVNGVITGVSDWAWRAVFLASMTLVGAGAFLVDQSVFGYNPPTVAQDAGLALVLPIAAGILCGFGSQLGSGCTSGHGVCGLPRFSLRSLVSVCTFMATGFAASTTLGAVVTGPPPSNEIPSSNSWLLVLAACVVTVCAVIAHHCPLCNDAPAGQSEAAPLACPTSSSSCSTGACADSSPSSSPLHQPINVLRSSIVTGMLFGVGLAVSGMCNPSKVKDFLDPVHGWDPSLAFVMGGAVCVNVVTFRFILRRPNPMFADRFFVPSRTDVTWELVVGSAIFGLGWGLAGYCPAPAFVSLSTENVPVTAWVCALIAGMALHQVYLKMVKRFSPSQQVSVKPEGFTSEKAGIAPVGTVQEQEGTAVNV